MVWPSRVRHREPKHAFEDALDEALLDADGNPILLDGLADRVTGPSVGSLGDIPVASGYVAAASITQAYEAEAAGAPLAAPPPAPLQRPGEAAAALVGRLAARGHAPGELQRLRRRFAARHHPDRVPADLREEAVSAMAEVNAAIDRALKALRSEPPRRR